MTYLLIETTTHVYGSRVSLDYVVVATSTNYDDLQKVCESCQARAKEHNSQPELTTGYKTYAVYAAQPTKNDAANSASPSEVSLG